MTTVYLGLGSNLGDRRHHLRNSLERLEQNGVAIQAVSSVYETDPVGPVADQPAFLNCTVRASYDGAAEELLRTAMAIETAMGRTRTVAMGPRTIDIDILYFGDHVIDGAPDLIVPHPRIQERRFVLIPMTELDPDHPHPSLGSTQSELLARTTDRSAVQLVGEVI